MKLASSRPSPAMVVAIAALIVAMGGTSYAVTALPSKSVGVKQLKKNAVTGKAIKSGAVTSGKVRDGSLLTKDFKSGQIPLGPKGDKGDPGAKGDQGDKGDKGDPGDVGTVGAATVQFFQATADLADGANASYSVFCLDGEQAIAGGGRGDDTLSEGTVLTNTRPAISAANQEPPTDGQSFTGWRITVVNPVGLPTTGIRPEVWAVCVPAPSAP
jgi:hypothetical protein